MPDPGAFDLVWLPAPFIAAADLDCALRVCHRALRPDGWLAVGMAGEPEDDAARATDRWLSELRGGSAEAPSTVERSLAGLGFVEIDGARAIPGGPWLLFGRRP